MFPPLPLDSWRDTRDTLHMWTQIAGKICLALTAPVNHYWNVTLRVVPHGLVTPPLPYRGRVFAMTFDLLEHQFVIETSDGVREVIALQPRTVAEFYELVMSTLRRIEIDVRIWPMPVEVANPIRFDQDVTHGSYDPDAVETFQQVLLAIEPVFESFRGGFIGKSSPVHFFWGSFDLAVTRFSGRRAPERPGVDAMTREAYSHEVSSVGFWPGGGNVHGAAFYSYAAPEPHGFKDKSVRPDAALYDRQLSEFLLMYDDVRKAESPTASLLEFCQSTYEAAATLGNWDRSALER